MYRSLLIFSLLTGLFTLILQLTFAACVQARILASGDEFEVTESYLYSLEKYYASGGFSSTADQYLNQAIRFKILAHEAKEMGLEPYPVNVENWDHDPDNPYNQQLIKDIGLAEAYLADKIVSYPVDEEVIISFYRSNPSRFLEGPWGDADMLPLDSEMKVVIRMYILDTIRSRIIDIFYDELSAKHEVQIYE